jgi:alkanesulfonate monooxygenase SsuD/methylene tetrahydromethanopterin reductase-like flavin-dependent oxidoreductase (luciferase family)
MAEIGYFLASEEHGPAELVRQAQQAEQAGFRSVWISDHYHPWNDRQGQSPFVWSVIGGIAATTDLKARTSTSTSWATAGPGSTPGWRCWRRPSRSCASCGRAG